MSGPGTGRYTTYVPIASDRNTLLRKLFNAKADNEAGVFYGTADQTNNIEAAKVVSARASSANGLIPESGKQAGDLQMFPEGVDLSYGNAPNLNDVAWETANSTFGGSPSNAGGPANPYAPDISSPGPGKTSPYDKSSDPKIAVKDMKGEAYVPGAPGTGTVSPDSTSSKIGMSPFGKALVKGKSSV